jgi:hypothetical protein
MEAGRISRCSDGSFTWDEATLRSSLEIDFRNGPGILVLKVPDGEISLGRSKLFLTRV